MEMITPDSVQSFPILCDGQKDAHRLYSLFGRVLLLFLFFGGEGVGRGFVECDFLSTSYHPNTYSCILRLASGI